MFICDKCLKEKGENEKTILRSYGPCEVCHEVADCNDTSNNIIEKYRY